MIRGLLLLFALTLPLGASQAHDAGISTSRITVEGREIQAQVNALARDYDKALEIQLSDGPTGEVNPLALSLFAEDIEAYVARHVNVRAGEEDCSLTSESLTAVDVHVTARLAWSCPDNGRAITYGVTLFHEIDEKARHVALVEGGENARETMLDKEQSELSLIGPATPFLVVAKDFLVTGIEHIFLGYDHIAFLIAVIAWGRRFWPLFKVVTAFTVAHSITLSLAALGIVTPPSWLIEPLIAASIVFVAAENFFVHNIAKRWRVTFLFGLIHGFGFAGVLREIGLPQDALVPALAFFNVGVEVGQAAIIAIVLPLLLLFDRATRTHETYRTGLVYVASTVILLLGLYWLTERTALAAIS